MEAGGEEYADGNRGWSDGGPQAKACRQLGKARKQLVPESFQKKVPRSANALAH